MLGRLANVIYWAFSGISGLVLLWSGKLLFPGTPDIKGYPSLPEGYILDPRPINWNTFVITIAIAIALFLFGRAVKYILVGK